MTDILSACPTAPKVVGVEYHSTIYLSSPSVWKRKNVLLSPCCCTKWKTSGVTSSIQLANERGSSTLQFQKKKYCFGIKEEITMESITNISKSFFVLRKFSFCISKVFEWLYLWIKKLQRHCPCNKMSQNTLFLNFPKLVPTRMILNNGESTEP